MNAICFAKDGTIRTFEDIRPGTYLSTPVFVPDYKQWVDTAEVPEMLHTGARLYKKTMESPDYTVFVEE